MNSDDPQTEKQMAAETAPIWKIIAVASVAAGVQFGWAIQLSLLTPYVQLLGVSHTMSSLIWLCGPVSGIIVQPTVGYISDRLDQKKFGRRKPFITAGTLLIVFSVILIGFAADLGHNLGDNLAKKTKPRAVALFVLGFWILDIANNVIQGSTRAFLADLSKDDHRKIGIANGFFSFFMAIGNILGYAAGSTSSLYKIMSFTKTDACETYCANLKTCFLIDIVILLFVVILAVVAVKEPVVHSIIDEDAQFFSQIKSALKNLGKPMWCLFIVTAFNWIAWFPFIMFNTDWVGLEIYGGDPQGNPSQKRLYDMGVRTGSLGLMLTAATLGCTALFIDAASKLMRGARRFWGVVNFVLAAALISTVPLTMASNKFRKQRGRYSAPAPSIKSGVLVLFAATGIPQAVTFSVPFALASMFSSDSGAGQGLSLGLMNLAICIPQMFVSLISGPVDKLFGGGNLPAFVLGSISAITSGILAFVIIPPSSANA